MKGTFGIIFLVALTATAVTCGGGGYGTTPSTTPTPTPSVAAAYVTITINGMNGSLSFSPNPASVKVGQTVAWRNADSIAHTATGSGFDTGVISPGGTSAPVTFAAAASNGYHCSIHPTMVGTLSTAQ